MTKQKYKRQPREFYERPLTAEEAQFAGLALRESEENKMKHLTKALLIFGWMSMGFGILGTLGAVDSGSIDMKQALIQCLICIGVGLACFVGRWVLFRFQK